MNPEPNDTAPPLVVVDKKLTTVENPPGTGVDLLNQKVNTKFAGYAKQRSVQYQNPGTEILVSVKNLDNVKPVEPKLLLNPKTIALLVSTYFSVSIGYYLITGSFSFFLPIFFFLVTSVMGVRHVKYYRELHSYEKSRTKIVTVKVNPYLEKPWRHIIECRKQLYFTEHKELVEQQYDVASDTMVNLSKMYAAGTVDGDTVRELENRLFRVAAEMSCFSEVVTQRETLSQNPEVSFSMMRTAEAVTEGNLVLNKMIEEKP